MSLEAVQEALEELRFERIARSPLAPTADVDAALAALAEVEAELAEAREQAEQARQELLRVDEGRTEWNRRAAVAEAALAGRMVAADVFPLLAVAEAAKRVFNIDKWSEPESQDMDYSMALDELEAALARLEKP